MQNAMHLYSSKAKGRCLYSLILNMSWLNEVVTKIMQEKEKNMNCMANYMTAMHLINESDTKEAVLKTNYFYPGSALE